MTSNLTSYPENLGSDIFKSSQEHQNITLKQPIATSFHLHSLHLISYKPSNHKIVL
jgi:hypothetical protein